MSTIFRIYNEVNDFIAVFLVEPAVKNPLKDIEIVMRSEGLTSEMTLIAIKEYKTYENALKAYKRVINEKFPELSVEIQLVKKLPK